MEQAFSKEALFKASTRVITVPIPELEIVVSIRGIDGAERAAVIDGFNQANGASVLEVTKAVQARLTQLCLVDENGNRLFTDDEGQIDQVLSLSPVIIDRVSAAAQKLAAIGIKAEEQTEKN